MSFYWNSDSWICCLPWQRKLWPYVGLWLGCNICVLFLREVTDGTIIVVTIFINSTKLGKLFCLQGINYFNLMCWNCSMWSKHISRDSCWCCRHASLSHKCKFVLCSGDWGRLATTTFCTHFHSFSHNTPGMGLEATRQWPEVTSGTSQFSCKVGNKRGEKQLQDHISVTLLCKLTLPTSSSSVRGRIYFVCIWQFFSRMILGENVECHDDVLRIKHVVWFFTRSSRARVHYSALVAPPKEFKGTSCIFSIWCMSVS